MLISRVPNRTRSRIRSGARASLVSVPSVVLALIFSLAFLHVDAQVKPAEEPGPIFDQAQDLHEKGDLAGAIKLYEKALAIMPEFPEAEYQRAAALSSLGKSAEAIKGYLRAAELRPDWPLPYSVAGGLLVDAGRFDEAKSVLAKALELQPSDPQAITALASLYIETKAEPALLTSLLDRITPLTSRPNATSSLWSAKAALESETGKVAAARVSLQKALSLNPSDRNALSQAATMALLDGDIERAKDVVNKLEAVDPRADHMGLLKAEVLYRSGDAGGALKMLEAYPPSNAAAGELRSRINSTSSNDPVEL